MSGSLTISGLLVDFLNLITSLIDSSYYEIVMSMVILWLMHL